MYARLPKPLLLSFGPLGTNLSDILIKIQNFHENESENIVCEMARVI